jgi:hypothetical protein
MNTYGFDAPATADAGGSFLSTPGWYHFLIIEMNDSPKKGDGGLLDGFKVTANVLDGSPRSDDGKQCSEVDKHCGIMFFSPSMSARDGGEFARKKIARFFLATNLMKSDQLGNKIDVNLQDAIGEQFVAKIDITEDGRYCELSFAEIYHIDDAKVRDIPKSTDEIAHIPPENRLTNGKAAAPKRKAKAKPKPQPAVAAIDDIDDI